MAQDYNIYIHGNGHNGNGGSATRKTTPFDVRPAEETAMSDSIAPFVSDAAKQTNDFLQNGVNSVVNSGISTLGKASPWIALGIGLTKGVESVAKTGFEHLETYTGNYQYAMGLHNLETTIGNALNPVGYMTKQIRYRAQARIEQRKIDQERTLIGNSMFNKVKVGI